MKIFIVKSGTKILLSNDDGKSEKIISKKEAIFDLEDIIDDPVKYQNNLINQQKETGKIETNTKQFLLQILGDGYTKFRLKKGVHTLTDYKYAYVNSKDVETMC